MDPTRRMTTYTPETFTKVRQIAADIRSVPANSITAESSPQQLEGWDSVNHLNMVLAVEEEFGLQFSPEDFDRMKNVGALAALVDSKRG